MDKCTGYFYKIVLAIKRLHVIMKKIKKYLSFPLRYRLIHSTSAKVENKETRDS